MLGRFFLSSSRKASGPPYTSLGRYKASLMGASSLPTNVRTMKRPSPYTRKLGVRVSDGVTRVYMRLTLLAHCSGA